MAEDWAADVRKYVPDADEGIIAGIVRYCGIALQKVDSSLVSFSDAKETDRVRENFLKKKLGLSQADEVLDKAIAAVGERMKADRTKNRVTVYYLLSEAFDSLHLFAKAGSAKLAGDGGAVAAAGAGAAALGLAGMTGAGDAAPVAAAPSPPPPPPAQASAGVAGALGAGAAMAAGSAASAASAPALAARRLADAPAAAVAQDEETSWAWLLWLLLALLAAFLIWWLFFRGGQDAAADSSAAAPATEAAASATESGAATPAALVSAPAEGSVAIPTGAGVTSEMRDGKPVVKVYFDTGKTALAPAFPAAAAGLKDYLAAHSGTSLAISGYNDASGNAAANAELAKNRAQAVAAALVAGGIPQTSVALVKPEQTTDTSRFQPKRLVGSKWL